MFSGSLCVSEKICHENIQISTVGFDASAVTRWWKVDPTWAFEWIKRKKRKSGFYCLHATENKTTHTGTQRECKNKESHWLTNLSYQKTKPMETNGQRRQKPECLNTNEGKWQMKIGCGEINWRQVTHRHRAKQTETQRTWRRTGKQKLYEPNRTTLNII